MAILLITTDLATSSKVAGAAAQTGATLATHMSATTPPTAAPDTELVFVDLAMPHPNLASLVAALRGASAPPARIIAFGSHVHEERLQEARDAGCDQVLSRGAFFARLSELLAPTRSAE